MQAVLDQSELHVVCLYSFSRLGATRPSFTTLSCPILRSTRNALANPGRAFHMRPEVRRGALHWTSICSAWSSSETPSLPWAPPQHGGLVSEPWRTGRPSPDVGCRRGRCDPATDDAGPAVSATLITWRTCKGATPADAHRPLADGQIDRTHRPPVPF
jgi:hypothetical protein